MPRLRVLSGAKVIKILEEFGFLVSAQKGSHVKMRRIVDRINQTLTIPKHKELDKGTLKAILVQTARYIPENDLWGYFYLEN